MLIAQRHGSRFRRLQFETMEHRLLLHGGSLLVDNPVDESDGDFSLGDFSLREAVQVANNNPGTDTIEFNMLFLSGFDLELTMIDSDQSALVVTDSLVIDGPGAKILAVDASPLDSDPNALGDGARIFNLPSGVDMEIRGLNLKGGDVNGPGGAIQSFGTLTLRDVTITDNAATRGGGIANFAIASVESSNIFSNVATVHGGGILNDKGTITVNHSHLIGNLGIAGGAIRNDGGTLEVNDSQITGNVALDGAGIENVSQVAYDYYYNPYTYQGYFDYTVYSGSLTMRRSVVSNNRGMNGGGVTVREGTDTYIADSTIANNNATASGGGLWTSRNNDYPFYSGGAVTITNSTISGNFASQGVGGILDTSTNPEESLDILYSTVTNNQSFIGGDGGGGIVAIYSSRLRLYGSIIAENSSINPANNHDLFVGSGSTIDLAFSLVGDATGAGLTEAPVGAPDSNGNLIGGPIFGAIDPDLAPLADNGGPTLTHALFGFSPAIDGVTDLGSAPATDQRGRPRSRGAGIDMGAFEFNPNGPNGDFDNNSLYECADIDALVGNLVNGTADPVTYDLNDDDTVNFTDVHHWLAEAGAVNLPSGNPFLQGDANLDGFVDGIDFIIWNLNRFTSTGAWCQADFNADGTTDGSDFVIWNNSRFRSSGDLGGELSSDLGVERVAAEGALSAEVVADPAYIVKHPDLPTIHLGPKTTDYASRGAMRVDAVFKTMADPRDLGISDFGF